MEDVATVDSNFGVAKDATRSNTMLRFVGSYRIAVRTTTTTIDVTMPASQTGSADNGGVGSIGIVDGDMGIALHVAVGTTAIDAARDSATIDSDIGVAHIGFVYHLRATLLEGIGSTGETLAATEDIAVVASIGADAATIDGDIGGTRGFASHRVDTSNGMAVGGIGILESTHRSHGTTTIDTVVDLGTVANGNMGVAVDTTGGVAIFEGVLPENGVGTLAAAENIAALHTGTSAVFVLVDFTLTRGKVNCDTIILTARDSVEGIVERDASDDTAADDDVGTFLHVAVLATTEDVTHHLGVAADGDNGAVGKGQMLQ